MSDGTTTDDGLRRAAHRVLMAAFDGPQMPDWVGERLGAGLGSVCLFGSNLIGDDAQATQITAQLHAAAPDGCLIALDEEGGDVTRLDARSGSRTAGHAVLGAVDDETLTRAVALGLGARLHRIGIDLDLAPVADVNCEPDNPVIGVRSFGADPVVVARHVVAFTQGLQDAGVAACVKHFPGHGATREDSHLAMPRLDADLVTLHGRELVPFVAAVRAGAAAVMTAHIVITAVDPDRPATTSAPVLDLLRGELGFEGLVVTDALDMAGVSPPHGGLPAAAVAALAAGADLLCLGPERVVGEMDAVIGKVVEAVIDAVHGGELPAQRLAAAAARVDALIAAPRMPVDDPGDAPGVGDPDAAADPNVVAARRALHLEAPAAGVPELAGALVLEFETGALIASGSSVPSPAARLAALVPGTQRRIARADDADGAAGHLRAAGGRPLVVVVRDAHRHRWVREQVQILTDARPDLVLVETGWPPPDPPGDPRGLLTSLGLVSPHGLPTTVDTVRLWTYGSSTVSVESAASLLTQGHRVGD